MISIHLYFNQTIHTFTLTNLFVGYCFAYYFYFHSLCLFCDFCFVIILNFYMITQNAISHNFIISSLIFSIILCFLPILQIITSYASGLISIKSIFIFYSSSSHHINLMISTIIFISLSLSWHVFISGEQESASSCCSFLTIFSHSMIQILVFFYLESIVSLQFISYKLSFILFHFIAEYGYCLFY